MMAAGESTLEMRDEGEKRWLAPRKKDGKVLRNFPVTAGVT